MLPLIRNLRPDVTGYWGQGNASVDWCESNYTVTMYLAEFANSTSSFAMILAGLIGMYLHMGAEYRFHMAFASTIICTSCVYLSTKKA
jgi:dihydroceramidase